MESDLNLDADTDESALSLSLIELMLSISAPLALVPSDKILLERETVSLANLLFSMFEVSAIFSFKLILLLKLVEIVEVASKSFTKHTGSIGNIDF